MKRKYIYVPCINKCRCGKVEQGKQLIFSWMSYIKVNLVVDKACSNECDVELYPKRYECCEEDFEFEDNKEGPYGCAFRSDKDFANFVGLDLKD